jgi:hypothetical protein
MAELEKQLKEELKRFNQINRYAKKMITEQDAPEDPAAPGAVPPAGDVPPPPTGGEIPPPPEGGADPALDVPPPPEGDLGADMGADVGAPTDDVSGEMDSTEEIDITDLVNMTKSIKKDMENKSSDNVNVIAKMDDIFTKLDDLESKLADMDSIIDRIDQLGSKVEQMKEPTPVEKLEMRSLDSYPFNKNPEQFFQEKRGEMERSGKNTYELKGNNVPSYSKDQIKQTFNPEGNKDEFRY